MMVNSLKAVITFSFFEFPYVTLHSNYKSGTFAISLRDTIGLKLNEWLKFRLNSTIGGLNSCFGASYLWCLSSLWYLSTILHSWEFLNYLNHVTKTAQKKLA